MIVFEESIFHLALRKNGTNHDVTMFTGLLRGGRSRPTI